MIVGPPIFFVMFDGDDRSAHKHFMSIHRIGKKDTFDHTTDTLDIFWIQLYAYSTGESSMIIEFIS